ncbi:MAG: MnhB domain-containing protein [Acidimicrobiales bacterium]
MTDGRPFGGDRSPVLDESVRLVFHTGLVLSLYLLFVGHNAPGGGFSGGLVAGAAIFLRFVAGGRAAGALPGLGYEVLCGLGLLISSITGVAALAGGLGFLESWVFERELPILGVVKFTGTLPFDIGVYLVVVGLIAAIVDSLGREADASETHALDPADRPGGSR